MHISKNLTYFFILPALLSVVAIAALVLWGLRPGIDLSGGSLLQVSYTTQVPTPAQMQTAAQPLGLGEIRIQPAGTSTFILRTEALSNDQKNNLEQALGTLGGIHEDQYTSV